MKTTWTVLDEITSDYRTLTTRKNPDGKYATAVFCGLRVRLSDVVGGLPPEGRSNLFLVADTLVVDVPSPPVRGAVVMARCLDVSVLPEHTLQVAPHEAGRTLWQFLARETTGGPALRLTTPQAAAEGQPPFTVPAGEDPLQVVYYTVTPDGRGRTRVEDSPEHLEDILATSWALNGLKASFAAAAWLLHSDHAGDRAAAHSMLSWVVACVRARGRAGTPLPGAYRELHSQAAALLVPLNVAPGALYVPALSASFYESQVGTLLAALQRYEDYLGTLTVRSDVRAAVAEVSRALEHVAQDEMAPLEAQLADIDRSIISLGEEIRALQHLFHLGFQDARTTYQIMVSKSRLKEIWAFVQACIDLSLAAVEAGATVGSVVSSIGAFKKARGTIRELTNQSFEGHFDPDVDEPSDDEALTKARATRDDALVKALKGIADVAKRLFKEWETAEAAVDAVRGKTSSKLTTLAERLMEAQAQLLTSLQAAIVLTAQAETDAAADAELPASLAAVKVDPGMAWDNYITEVEAELTNLYNETRIREVNTYLASLKILAQYGKAIAAKMATYASQLAQGTVVVAQIRAAAEARARWEELAQKASDDEEKLAVLRGLVRTRIDALKRSVFVAWTHYRNAYFFLHFEAPPASINLSMNAAALKDAFAQVSLWIAKLLGEAPAGQKVRLPDDNVRVSFAFDVVRRRNGAGDAGEAASTADVAVLTPANGETPALLTWTIPHGSAQLKGVLPHNGNVAVWIKEAAFFLEDIEPNAQENVIVEVATSGTYQNGYGVGEAYTFVNQGLVGDYAYHAGRKELYIPWSINTDVHATPTPFTQWTMAFDPDGGDPTTATRLRMDLRVAYRKRG